MPHEIDRLNRPDEAAKMLGITKGELSELLATDKLPRLLKLSATLCGWRLNDYKPKRQSWGLALERRDKRTQESTIC
jgi:predicted DNA-binding transcriptional regulator AlpA